MQTTTQETEALTAAEQASRHKRTSLIFLICFLEAERDASILRKHWMGLLSRSVKPSPLKDAIFGGYIAIDHERKRCAEELTKRGQLLFAFPGTTALQGVAQ